MLSIEEKVALTKGEKQGQGERKSGEEVKSENELRLRRVMKDKDDKIEMLERLNTALKAKVEEKKNLN